MRSRTDERPGRTELIQSAYQRYFETPECVPEPPQIPVQTHRDRPAQPKPPHTASDFGYQSPRHWSVRRSLRSR